MKIVIALGGNALGYEVEKQKENAYKASKALLPIIEDGNEVIITHGNGPQVGLINLAFSEGKKVNEKVFDMPFVECSALSEGYIGYHIERALEKTFTEAKLDKLVVSLITEVLVDKDDPAFQNPTKPIGSFLSLEEAKKMNKPYIEDAGRGYRRVIASPKPIKVIQEEAINDLYQKGYVVITCGGGGIPVIKTDNGFEGIDAVIDKDYASSLLARSINADVLMILTEVEKVSLNYNTPNQIDLNQLKYQDAIKYNEQGHFKKGSMKPKVEACLEFVKDSYERKAIITSLENAYNALKGLTGTTIKY